jgi:hypothetical protein
MIVVAFTAIQSGRIMVSVTWISIRHPFDEG